MQTIKITITSTTPANVVLTEGGPKKQDETTRLALLLKKLQNEKEEKR